MFGKRANLASRTVFSLTIRNPTPLKKNSKGIPYGSVVEPFHFGPAPAPASQDGGSGSSSRSSPVVTQFVAEIFLLQISLLNLPGLVLVKERYECFALLFQYFK